MSEKFISRSIGKDEHPFWSKAQFLKETSHTSPTSFIGIEFNPTFYIDQKDLLNFKEFDETGRGFGLSSEDMSRHGCGISALHMTLITLSDSYARTNGTVSNLAVQALSLHRNDLVEEGKIAKVGTPVFAEKIGWYHDALVYVGIKNGLQGSRFQDITLEELSGELSNLKSNNREPFAIISVRDSYLLEGKDPRTTHLIIVNGMDVEGENVREIRIVDSSPKYGLNLVNYTVEITDWVRNSFLGRAMIFYPNE